MNKFSEMKDDIDEVYSAAPVTRPARKMWVENCARCGGTGRYNDPSQYGSHCFDCDGRGKREYTTSPEQRAKSKAKYAENKANAAEKKAQEIAAKTTAYIEAHPEAHEWILANRGSFDFAASLHDSLIRYGSLTDGQLLAVNKYIVKAQERKAEKAAIAESAPSVNVEAIEKAFRTAQEKGIRTPKLNLDTFKFKLAPSHGKNPGAIYVTEKEEYLGKIAEGKFHKSRGVANDIEQAIIKAASDPHNAAIAYGQRFGVCAVCGRELTNHASIDLGIGPICRDKMGW